MSSQLIELNSLNKNEHDIWVNPDAVVDFGYSDGSNEEQYLVDLFKSTQDLSLDSPELAVAIQDWASLYHLSSARANLLRNINLPKNSKILELGCGCGAITRYLAEQGHKVTAVEGSLKRAQIARLRNRGMPNVEVICQNFNSLLLPGKHYDLVLFIGVLEYARRFSDQDDISPEQAVVQLLNKTKAALKSEGLIIIAIENRTGLKYQFGALEDHLAIPNVGINDYQGYEFTGIKTYDYAQWQHIFSEADLVSQFYYPFPDYKLPNLVVSDHIDEQDAIYLSSQIQSTDPISDWIMPQSEQQKWLDVIRHKQLPQKSNSFGIVAAREPIEKDRLFSSSWCLYDRDEIKPDCRLDINSNKVNKIIKNNKIEQIFNKPMEDKKSLLNVWIEELSSNSCQQTLSVLTAEAFEKYRAQRQTTQLANLDQIMFSASDSTLYFAKYWQLDFDICAEQQIFHFLVDFCVNHKKHLAKDIHLITIEQIIAACFDSIDHDFADIKHELVEFEQNFRNLTRISAGSVEQDLKTMISSFNQYDFGYVNSELFFSDQAGLFSPDNVKTILGKQTVLPEKLYFRELSSNNRYLRFDPCDHHHGNQHCFSIGNLIVLDNVSNTLDKVPLNFSLQTNDLECIDRNKNIFKVIGIDPQIIFCLPEDLKTQTPSYNLAIEIQWLGKHSVHQ